MVLQEVLSEHAAVEVLEVPVPAQQTQIPETGIVSSASRLAHAHVAVAGMMAAPACLRALGMVTYRPGLIFTPSICQKRNGGQASRRGPAPYPSLALHCCRFVGRAPHSSSAVLRCPLAATAGGWPWSASQLCCVAISRRLQQVEVLAQHSEAPLSAHADYKTVLVVLSRSMAVLKARLISNRLPFRPLIVEDMMRSRITQGKHSRDKYVTYPLTWMSSHSGQ